MTKDTEEIYCLQWSTTNRIADSACYFDRERAEIHRKHANKSLNFFRKLSGGMWILRVLEVKKGKAKPRKVKEGT